MGVELTPEIYHRCHNRCKIPGVVLYVHPLTPQFCSVDAISLFIVEVRSIHKR